MFTNWTVFSAGAVRSTSKHFLLLLFLHSVSFSCNFALCKLFVIYSVLLFRKFEVCYFVGVREISCEYSSFLLSFLLATHFLLLNILG